MDVTGDWQRQLADCRDFVTSAQTWPVFSEYFGRIEEWLHFSYPGGPQPVNALHRERLQGISSEETSRLSRVFERLCDSRRGATSAQLSSEDAALLANVIERAGDLKIGTIFGSWPLDTFKIAGTRAAR